ncbi:hypothetical protein K523DRAFT_289151 [Schizophyllum commune Tattone D]|nr:hypothetical protein K523DRAFT_289151 [Schizophyllum commune Tattone D]
MASGTGPSSLGKHPRDSGRHFSRVPQLDPLEPPSTPSSGLPGRLPHPHQSTPLTRLRTTAAKDSGRDVHAPEARENSVMDNKGCSVGPMPMEEFMRKFVPKAPTDAPRVEYRVDHVKSEKDLEAVVLQEVMKITKNSVVIDTSATADRNASRGQKMKPDLMMYGYLIDLAKGRTQFDMGKLGGELKKLLEIFNDDADPGLFEPKADQVTMTNAVGQVLRYIEEMHSRQNRVFSFFLFISKDSFRIIRADRDGLIVTKSTPWSGLDPSEPNPLTEFLHRFDHLSEGDQGFDTSVRDVSPDDANAARAREALAKYMPSKKPQSKKKRSEAPIRKIGVPCDKSEGGLRWFYISEPTVIKTTGLRTRATRGYPAWDPTSEKVVFIKDAWRSNAKDALAEADVIRDLNTAGVQYAPQLYCGGDLDQRTITDQYVNAEWNRGHHKVHHPRIHHRIAMNYGQPLWKFRSSKHLLQILHNVFTGHQQAVSRCRKLHRDFSAWNIMWDEETGEGILTDWDLCARMPPAGASDNDPTVNMMAQLPTGSGRPPDRTGTWAFMSSLSLGKQGKLHDVQDDLESIFWVALYIIILYFPFDRKDAIHIIDTVINQYSFHPNGVPFGGHGKKIFIEEATLKPGDEYSIILPDTVSSPLLEWIEMYLKMLLGWHTYHKALARWTGGRSQGAEGDDDDDDADNDEDDDDNQKPRAPALRDYRVLDKKWRSILDKGERKGTFKDRDRLFDELHNGSPDQVLAQYRVLVKIDLKIETQINATESKQAHGASQQEPRAVQQELHASQQEPPASQQELHVSQHTLADSDSELDDRDTLPVVGPAMADAADDMEEEEATRAAKRRRTVANGFQRTSSPTAGQSGRISPGKGRSLTPE